MSQGSTSNSIRDGGRGFGTNFHKIEAYQSLEAGLVITKMRSDTSEVERLPYDFVNN